MIRSNIMKRLCVFLIAIAIIVSSVPLSGFAASDLEVKINSEYITFTPEPKLLTISRGEYYILAPARPLATALGAEIEWDEEKQAVIFKKGDKNVSVVINSNTICANGEEVETKAPAETENGTAFVSIEDVGRALNYHILRERCGKIIRIVQKTTVSWPGEGEIKPGMAELKSTYHRKVPTEFEKSNQLDDLIFYTDYEYVPEEELLKSFAEERDYSNIPDGEIVYSEEDFLYNMGEKGATSRDLGGQGGWEVAEIDDETVEFDKVLRIESKYPNTTNTGAYIIKSVVPMDENVDPLDKYLISFKIRLVEGGNVDTGLGKIYLQIEEAKRQTWKKSVASNIEFGDKWITVYELATGIEGADSIGIRPSFNKQIVEIGGFTIKKLDRDADTSMFEKEPFPNLVKPQMSKDAPWRKEALERIEQIRKGDFKVVVKDKNGNPIENADVRFDMFEHEFKWGAVLDSASANPDDGGLVKEYMETLEENFNSTGCGNYQKLGFVDANATSARRVLDDAYSRGIKSARGHAIWMPSIRSGHERPYRFFGPFAEQNLETAEFEKYMKEHIKTVVEQMPEIYEWDVTNENTNRRAYASRYGGYNLIKKVYEWCREIFPEGMDIVHCDNQVGNELYWEQLDFLQKENVDYDGIATQGHSYVQDEYDAEDIYRPTKVLQYYDRWAYEYEKKFSVTEQTFYCDNQEDQADFARDRLIAVFSHPAAHALHLFWYTDNFTGAKTEAGCAMLYDREFNKKLGWYQWADLIYNKWWTRNAMTTTDEAGKGQVRGFYGDYDVTVIIDGKEVKTVMAAFHKGYENELTIVVE